MEHFEEKIQPEKKVKVLVKTTCDLCGSDLSKGEFYAIDDVEINRRSGISYPEGGSGKEVKVDMCGDCFKAKLIPWLKSQNVAIIETEWDY